MRFAMKETRTLITAGTILVLAVSVLPAEGTHAKQTYVLSSGRKGGNIDRVAGVLEVGGELTEAVDEKVQRMKMRVDCTFSYDEKTLELPSGPANRWRSARYYDQLDAVIKVENEVVKPVLRGERRLIGVAIELPKTTLFSPHGTLTREELDLIDVPANSLLLDRLLPEKPAAIGDTWKLPEELMVAWLGLDAVSRSDVQCVLKEVTDAVARIELSGRVEGASDGVSTDIELKARYRYDRRSKRIDWLGLLVKEQRSIGHVKRGVDVVARFQLTISPKGASPQLTDAALENLTLEPTAALSQLSYASPEGVWRITHDRCWHVIGDHRELTILRRVDRGELIAQCNVSILPKVAPGKQITLADFQEDVQKALGESFGQFVEAGKRANDANYRVYRVAVRGEVSQLPIRWNYYLVADEHGHQVALAFTVEEKLLERFQNADEALIRSLRFVDPKAISAGEP
jgi:hypothetical protein